MSFPFSSVYFRQKVRNLFFPFFVGKSKGPPIFLAPFLGRGGVGWTNGNFKMRGALQREGVSQDAKKGGGN